MDVLYPAGAAERGLEQLKRFSALLQEQAAARSLFENPTVAAERRKELMNKIGDALPLDARIRNFLGLLIEWNRLEILDDVIEVYETLLDEKQGVVRARVTSAHALDSKQQSEVATRLESLTKKKVRVEVSVDPSLIGGLMAQVGSTIYDGSIRQQLQTFKTRLTEG
jgi:F-type H+-transporting ATPase subunit delta